MKSAAGVELRMCEPHLPGQSSAFFPQAGKIFRGVEAILYYLSIVHTYMYNHKSREILCPGIKRKRMRKLI